MADLTKVVQLIVKGDTAGAARALKDLEGGVKKTDKAVGGFNESLEKSIKSIRKTNEVIGGLLKGFGALEVINFANRAFGALAERDKDVMRLKRSVDGLVDAMATETAKAFGAALRGLRGEADTSADHIEQIRKDAMALDDVMDASPAKVREWTHALTTGAIKSKDEIERLSKIGNDLGGTLGLGLAMAAKTAAERQREYNQALSEGNLLWQVAANRVGAFAERLQQTAVQNAAQAQSDLFEKRLDAVRQQARGRDVTGVNLGRDFDVQFKKMGGGGRGSKGRAFGQSDRDISPEAAYGGPEGSDILDLARARDQKLKEQFLEQDRVFQEAKLQQQIAIAERAKALGMDPEVAADREMAAKLRLLEFQKQHTNDKAELLRLEDEADQVRHERMLERIEAEKAAQEAKARKYDEIAQQIGGATSQVAMLGITAAESGRKAALKAAAGFAAGKRNEMVILAISEAARAIAAGASGNVIGAAAHGAAAAKATAAAAALAAIAGALGHGAGGGGIGGGRGSQRLPEFEKKPDYGSLDPGRGGPTNDSGVPTSSSEARLQRGFAGGVAANGAPSGGMFAGATIQVLGATPDQVAQGLDKIMRRARQTGTI